jgi:thioester reductase-like protein
VTIPYDQVILTGATGALGSHLLSELLLAYPKVVCLANSQRSVERLAAQASGLRGRLKIVQWDLRDSDRIDAVAATIGKVSRLLVIHCAAEVSWTKPDRMVLPLNLDGTRHVAELAQKICLTTPTLVFLSTAYCEEGFVCRNAYERSKLAAERLLLTEFAAHMRVAIIKCSLIVGNSYDGRITQFNGVYPLVRVVASAEIPCLIADSDYELDLVATDIVSKEIAAAVNQLEHQRVVRLTVAAGPNSLKLSSFVAAVSARTNHLLEQHGLLPLHPFSVLTERQFRFLMKASGSWDLAERFNKVEQISEIMQGYIVHGRTGRAIKPELLCDDHPSIDNYVDVVIDYWLEQNHRHVLRTSPPSWALNSTVVA